MYNWFENDPTLLRHLYLCIALLLLLNVPGRMVTLQGRISIPSPNVGVRSEGRRCVLSALLFLLSWLFLFLQQSRLLEIGVFMTAVINVIDKGQIQRQFDIEKQD